MSRRDPRVQSGRRGAAAHTQEHARSQPRRSGEAAPLRAQRYRLDLEYDGTRYSGWQVQPNARTVQGVLGSAIEEASQTRLTELMGSGRTDAGVHALCQTAHLTLATPLSPSTLQQRINDELPKDIHVLRLRPVPDTFHARHDAVARAYVYQISRRRSAFAKPYVWWVKDRLDARRMQTAAAGWVGLHDFRSFTADDGPETRVRLLEATLLEHGDLILVRFVASHFLWKMVRQMVGTLVEVGRGRLRPEQAVGFLTRPSHLPAEVTAPPSGLFLECALYPGDAPVGALQPVTEVGRALLHS